MKKSSNEQALNVNDDLLLGTNQPAGEGWYDLFSGKNAIYLFTLLGGVTLYAVNKQPAVLLSKLH